MIGQWQCAYDAFFGLVVFRFYKYFRSYPDCLNTGRDIFAGYSAKARVLKTPFMPYGIVIFRFSVGLAGSYGFATRHTKRCIFIAGAMKGVASRIRFRFLASSNWETAHFAALCDFMTFMMIARSIFIPYIVTGNGFATIPACENLLIKT